MRKDGMKMLAAAFGLAFAPAAMAAVDVQITETYAGLSGEDGTVDWIELTNFGDTDADTGTYWYDDISAEFLEAGNLDSFILGPGESAVFLLDTAPADNLTYATALEEFTAIWGAGITVGHTNGGGGLGQGDDAVVLFDNTQAIVDTLTYLSGQTGLFQTLENLNDTLALSIDGQNGAYESAQFFNDNIGPSPDFIVSLVGSPGAVPEPATLMLLFGGAVCIVTRRRR